MKQEDYDEMKKDLIKGNKVLLAILITIGIAFLILKYYDKL
jgi:hypothetical protein